MRQAFWTRLTFPIGYTYYHYLVRSCSCHKWPWQSWGAKQDKAVKKLIDRLAEVNSERKQESVTLYSPTRAAWIRFWRHRT